MSSAENGLINLASKHSVEETLQRLEALLQEKHISVFAKVDHSGEAAKVGMEMRPPNCSSSATRRAALR